MFIWQKAFERWVGSNAFFLAVCQVYIHDNYAAIKAYKRIGFIPTGEVKRAFHEEHVFKLILEE